MKPALSATLLFFLITGKLTAQQSFFQYGFQAGGTRVNLYGNPFIEAFLEPDWRITGGPALYYPFARKWAIRSNLFFESKGSGGVIPLYDEEGDPMGIYNVKSRFNYMTVPLLFDFHFGRRLSCHLTGGPFMGLLLSRRTIYTDPASGEEMIEKGTSSFVPWDGGLVLGSGLRYGVNKRITVSMDTRLNLGMANIVSRPVLSSLTIYTLSSQFLLGIYYTPGYTAGKMRKLR